MSTGAETAERRIVVGVDGSKHSEKALRWGAFFAATFGIRLDAVTAWEYPPGYGWASVPPDWNPGQDMEKVLKDTLHAVFGDHLPGGMTAEVREGGAAQVLVEASKAASMVVVGSRGHGGFTGLLLGSVSANVAEHSHCPVMIIHGDHPVPPVPAAG